MGDTDTTMEWLDWLEHLIKYGKSEAPRGMPTKAIYDQQLIFNPRKPVVMPIGRKLSYRFMLAEAYWILTGDDTVAGIEKYNKNIAQFSDDGVKFFGAYGPKVIAQAEYVVNTLRRDKDSRQAIISIWRDSPPPTKDVPCTIMVQFRVDSINRLHSHVVMRSSDVWLGLPYDVFNFSMLMHMVASSLGVEVGNLRYTLLNTHLYERNELEATALIAGFYAEGKSVPNQPELKFESPLDVLQKLKTARDDSKPLKTWLRINNER